MMNISRHSSVFIILISTIYIFTASSFKPVKLLSTSRLGSRLNPLFSNTKKASNRDKRLQNILEALDQDNNRPSPPTTLMEDPLIPLVEKIILAADKRKASGITSFRVFHLTEVTSFMVVVEGNSKPQNMAIARSVEEDVEEQMNLKPVSKDGNGASGWILLDYGSVFVHIMTPKMRNFYKLEKRWKDAEFMDLSYLITESDNSSRGPVEYSDDAFNFEDTGDFDEEFGQEPDEELDVEEEEEDPFWK